MQPDTAAFIEQHRWAILVSVAVGVFMATLDSSIVNISLPSIAHQLHSDLPSTQWVVLAYMLGIAALLIPIGRLSDLWGRRKIFVGGMWVFGLGSLLCGLSHSIGQLIAMRVLQAIGAAGLMSCGPAITSEAFQSNRGRALGLLGSVVSLGAMLGPTLGGWIVGLWGWPWIFLINVPVGIVASVYAWKMQAPFDAPQAERLPFDGWGAFLTLLVLSSLLLFLTYGLTLPWHTPFNLALLCTFFLSLMGFIRHERRTPHPLVEFGLFRNRLLTGSCLASFLSFIGITTIFFLSPFYLQEIRQFSPAMSGSILMTTSLALFIVSPVSGFLSERLGSRNLAMLGMLISATGLSVMVAFTRQTDLLWIITGFFLVGVGNGLFHPPNSSQMLGSVPPRALGLVGGILAIVRTLGMTLAVTLVGVIFTHHQANLGQAHGFMPAFRSVFTLAMGLTTLNVIWIGWFRPRT